MAFASGRYDFSAPPGAGRIAFSSGLARLDDVTGQCHIESMSKTNSIKTVCVYCGSGPGTDPQFIEAASALGKAFAENGIGLVYGGGSIGLMGAVANGVLAHGGKVTGIIPDFLTARENALDRAQELIVTKNMHERKQLMFEHSDAFVALPGGIGTLEELVEQMTWAQLGRHTKPVLLANIANFWEPLLSLHAHMRQKEFIRQGLAVNFLTANRGEDIVPKLKAAALSAQPTASTKAVTEQM